MEMISLLYPLIICDNVRNSRSSFTKGSDITNVCNLDTSATSHRNTYWIVPRAVNDLFTERAKLLCEIQDALHIGYTSTPDKQKRFVITGLGGQGKSEICLKAASQMRKTYVLLIPLIFSVLSQLIVIGFREYSRSMSTSPLLLRATLSLSQSFLGG
jgi:hypothetical protein